ncbi:DUF86 domain-containing protein [bacterium]|nr:DUF86 domain-containing protein [FCB group bacterium]MBL7191198.1 DUF86 domain-containing protein [bacterium]
MQNFGEAARCVSNRTQQKYSNIPWTKIIGMRHKIVHDYLTVDDKIVWDVVKHEIPQLLAELKKIFPNISYDQYEESDDV